MLKIAIAQMNPIIGNVISNTDIIRTHMSSMASECDLLIFPELSILGYPPKDLLRYSHICDAEERALRTIISHSKTCSELGIIVGHTQRHANGGNGRYNAVSLILNGQVLGTQFKTLLPTYDVFDEARYFDPATSQTLIPFKSEQIGLIICEDAWQSHHHTYAMDPVECLAAKGATLLISIMASPFEISKAETRRQRFSTHAKTHRIPVVYANQVGANDDLIFDGRSGMVGASGHVIFEAPAFDEGVFLVKPQSPTSFTRCEDICSALELGIRDYVRKCGFSTVVLGLSGGIDSALVATLAANALGPENVTGIMMPSEISSRASLNDAKELADNLSINLRTLPIQDIVTHVEPLVTRSHPANVLNSLTYENMQARSRGLLLMAVSNNEHMLLLSTGNKSELAVGYCTLYGDMNGALNPLSDVPKTMVYELAHHINTVQYVIPESIIKKAPSAELRPDQKDQDTLPPYPVLDAIIYAYINEHQSPRSIIELGYDPEMVHWVIDAIHKNEYKRHQACLGLKITSTAFGSGRKMVLSAQTRYN